MQLRPPEPTHAHERSIEPIAKICAGTPKVEQPQSLYLNNRAENSHRPTQRRERQMQRFKSRRQAQEILSAHAFIQGHFHPRRRRMTANDYRAKRMKAFIIWSQETYVEKAA